MNPVFYQKTPPSTPTPRHGPIKPGKTRNYTEMDPLDTPAPMVRARMAHSCIAKRDGGSGAACAYTHLSRGTENVRISSTACAVPVVYARVGHTPSTQSAGGEAGMVRDAREVTVSFQDLAQQARAALTVEHARAARLRGRRELAPAEREAARRAAALQHAATCRPRAGQLVSVCVGRAHRASAASVGGPCRGASGRATARGRRIRKRRTSGRREKAARARAGSRKRCWAKCWVGAENW